MAEETYTFLCIYLNKLFFYENDPEELLNTLQTYFYKFDEDRRLLKEYAIKKVCKTEGAFNAETVEEGVRTLAYEQIDKWYEEQFEKFIETRDLMCWIRPILLQRLLLKRRLWM